MLKEETILNNYLRENGLKQSRTREQVMRCFLETERHLTAEELYRKVSRRFPSIGMATVYRTLGILCRAGLAEELRLQDGVARYEHKYRHRHHDHLVCSSCRKFVEVADAELERVLAELAESRGITPEYHSVVVYGTCRECSGKINE